MKHTQGPWRIDDNDDIVHDKTGNKIASCVWGWSESDWKANVRLIAAAPDLLECLKMAEEWKEHIEDDLEISGADMVDWFCDFYNQAMPLIRKAEGRGE